MLAGNGAGEYVQREIADTSRRTKKAGPTRLCYRPIRTVEGRTSDMPLIRVVDAGTLMLRHRVTRELTPGLAAIAAARNASVIPEAPARSIAIVVWSAERAVAIAEESDPAIQFTKAVQLRGHVGKL
jgi:hypothetical protein